MQKTEDKINMEEPKLQTQEMTKEEKEKEEMRKVKQLEADMLVYSPFSFYKDTVGQLCENTNLLLCSLFCGIVILLVFVIVLFETDIHVQHMIDELRPTENMNYSQGDL